MCSGRMAPLYGDRTVAFVPAIGVNPSGLDADALDDRTCCSTSDGLSLASADGAPSLIRPPTCRGNHALAAS